MTNRKRTSDQEPPAPEASSEASTAVAAPPAAANDNAGAANDNRPSFVERVGQRKRFSAPDPYLIAIDALAGVRLFESKQDRQMALKFGEGHLEDKPNQEIIDTLKEAGYRWNPLDKIWVHPIRSDSAMATRIEAERLYQEVRQMVRQQKGIDTSQEVPF
jgi:hypothetical protein